MILYDPRNFYNDNAKKNCLLINQLIIIITLKNQQKILNFYTQETKLLIFECIQ